MKTPDQSNNKSPRKKEVEPRTKKNLVIDSETTVREAIEILKIWADEIAASDEAVEFYRSTPGWSKLFKEVDYPPYQNALKKYNRALEINEWLNGKNAENEKLTLRETFNKMSDQQKLSLFTKRIASDVPTFFDDYLKEWWINRY